MFLTVSIFLTFGITCGFLICSNSKMKKKKTNESPSKKLIICKVIKNVFDTGKWISLHFGTISFFSQKTLSWSNSFLLHFCIAHFSENQVTLVYHWKKMIGFNFFFIIKKKKFQWKSFSKTFLIFLGVSKFHKKKCRTFVFFWKYLFF